MAEDLGVISQYAMKLPVRTLMLTHLNETKYCVVTVEGTRQVEEFVQTPLIRKTFDRCLLSDSPYAEEVKAIRIL